MATQPQTGLSYDDLAAFPEDNLRRELIGGELIVTAAPVVRHQRVVKRLLMALTDHEERAGGEALPAPTDVYLSDIDVVEPDVLYVAEGRRGIVEAEFVRGAPDLVIEVSSPTTRRIELVHKRDLYERYRVPEYWYVDLDADRVEVYRLGDDVRYPAPQILGRTETLTSPVLPGLSLTVDDVLGEA